MAYDPRQYVQQDKYGLGAASQIIGNTIAQMPERIDAKNLRDKAIAEAQKDSATMDISWQTIRKKFQEKAQKLVDQGLMKPEDVDAQVQMLRAPTEADKKDPGAYIDSLGKTYGELLTQVDAKARTQQAGGIAQTAAQGREPQMQEIQSHPVMEGQSVPRPGEESFSRVGGEMGSGDLKLESRMPRLQMEPTGIDKPGMEPAQTQEQALGRVSQLAQEQGVPMPTMEEMKQAPAIAGVPTMQERRLSEPQPLTEYQKQLLEMQGDRLENETARINQKWAEINRNKGKDTLKNLESQVGNMETLLDVYQKERDFLAQQIEQATDKTVKENLKIKFKATEQVVSQLVTRLPAAYDWLQLKRLEGEQERRDGMIQPKTGGSGGGAGAQPESQKRIQAKALLKKLQALPNPTPADLADIETIKKELGMQ